MDAIDACGADFIQRQERFLVCLLRIHDLADVANSMLRRGWKRNFPDSDLVCRPVVVVVGMCQMLGLIATIFRLCSYSWGELHVFPILYGAQ